MGGFQFSWRAALVSKSKKLRQRFIRKKRRNAREFWSLKIVPLTLVSATGYYTSHFCQKFILKSVVVFVLPKGPESFIKVTEKLSGPGCNLPPCSRTWVHNKNKAWTHITADPHTHTHMQIHLFTATLAIDQSTTSNNTIYLFWPVEVTIKWPNVWISKQNVKGGECKIVA